jgi:hypothetical protein
MTHISVNPAELTGASGTQGALAQLAGSVSGTAENLGAAAYAYTVTDATQMGGP